MMNKVCLMVAALGLTQCGRADNPVVTTIYSADPTARVHEGKLYVYPSHDVRFSEDLGVVDRESHGHVMTDYHAFSSENLFDWEDHGVVLAENEIPWALKNAYALWAPDCIYRDGTYFYYFPGKPADKSGFRQIGVATSKHPEGPFTPQPSYMKNAKGIDPNAFIDDNGQAYLYWGGGKGDSLRFAKLSADMLRLNGEVQHIKGLPQAYKEGPFVFKRGGVYYLTFPLNMDGTENISYATGPSATGPFTFRGKVLERSNYYTSHHSIVEYKGEWYIFYHENSLSHGHGALRSTCADRLFFNPDGTIQPVKPTLRGIGVCPAEREIQIDRYSEIHHAGIGPIGKPGSAAWKVEKIKDGGWLRYDQVDFGMKAYTKVDARVACNVDGAKIEIRWDKPTGLLISTLDVPNTGGLGQWATVTGSVDARPTGIEDLVLVFRATADNSLAVDWVQFSP